MLRQEGVSVNLERSCIANGQSPAKQLSRRRALVLTEQAALKADLVRFVRAARMRRAMRRSSESEGQDLLVFILA
jgi:hypothetical protein